MAGTQAALQNIKPSQPNLPVLIKILQLQIKNQWRKINSEVCDLEEFKLYPPHM